MFLSSKIIKERYDYKDEKIKTFIKDSLRKHGDKYDYSNTLYVKALDNVEIICKVEGHKSFSMTPSNHKRGQGCPMCRYIKLSEKFRMTKEEFIKKANKIHGVGRYDYSKINYVNNRTDVIIICNNHEHPYEFPQNPSNHLNGNGCKKCMINKLSNDRRMTKEEFIKKSNKLHKEKYDYSKVEYINNHTEVIIICPKHGEFKQTPMCHLQEKGCKLCTNDEWSNERRMTKEEFIKKSKYTHDDKYDYSKVNYKNNHTDVFIICPKHGEFKQTPHNHINGQGCPKCKNNYKGEHKIRKFLIGNEIEFEEQKKFEDCKDIRCLPFDFYIPKYNLCIEHDGIQHFKPTKRSNKMTDEESKENFKYIQNHDQIKNNYCEQKGINLLRIKYTENIKEKLIEYFKNIDYL